VPRRRKLRALIWSLRRTRNQLISRARAGATICSDNLHWPARPENYSDVILRLGEGPTDRAATVDRPSVATRGVPTWTDDVTGMNDGCRKRILPRPLDQIRLYSRFLDSVVAERTPRLHFGGRNLDAGAVYPDRPRVQKMSHLSAQGVYQMPRACPVKRSCR
jgi:hypothetical protein